MFPLIDLVATVGSLVAAPLFDFIKKKFIPSENDTPERTMGTLATTKPEVLGDYVKGMASLLDSQVKYFNRDVVGEASRWVINLRAAIRPIGVTLAFLTLIIMAVLTLTNTTEFSAEATELLTGIRVTCEVMVSSWFGHRISLK
jgi:hypothetical protein